MKLKAEVAGPTKVKHRFYQYGSTPMNYRLQYLESQEIIENQMQWWLWWLQKNRKKTQWDKNAKLSWYVVEGKMNMLHGNSLVKFVTFCNKNQQRPMFQGMTQRILLYTSEKFVLRGTSISSSSSVVGMAGGWKLELPKRLKGAYQVRFAFYLYLILPFLLFSCFFSIQFKSFPFHEDQSVLNYLSTWIPMLFYMLFYSILYNSHNRSDFASISNHLDSMWYKVCWLHGLRDVVRGKICLLIACICCIFYLFIFS